MLRNVRRILGHSLHATDGDIGKVKDFYFDSSLWTGRYLVVTAGGWLAGRRVLIPVTGLNPADWNEDRIPVNLTKQQIKDSPPAEEDEPVSRQYEEELHSIFDWHPYWTPGMLHPAPGISIPATEEDREIIREEHGGDPNLRSAKEIFRYTVVGRDGEIGPVHDFVFDDENWALRYLIADASDVIHEGGDRKLLISTRWIDEVSWPDTAVHVDLTHDRVRLSPHWDPERPITRDYEEELHTHYGRNRYWV